MSQAPDFTQTVSLRLSEVLADIGVNVRLVEKKRGAWLLIESIHTASIQLDDFETGSSRYYLGSRSEVTTTPGLQSDIDTVNCINQIEVIKDLSERELGKLSYLMIENESESPGYCLLEKPTSDDPSPVTVVDKFHYKDWLGRILLNKTMANAIPARVRAAAERSDERYNHQVFSHGPATVLAEPSLGSALDQKACSLLTPWFYTTLGSVLASRSIRKYNRISASALGCISMGLNTDVSSSKLKKASMFYCAGDIQETEIILEDTERKYDLNIVEPICNCYDIAKPVPPRRKFVEVSNNHNEKALQNIAAFCVRYLPSEIYCVPHELKYEMFRSTKYDLSFRGLANIWMDSAVADSLPYMYFLQYKTYNYLGKQDDKQRALSNLIRTINQEPNLGHRETALNLLGQCMEGEDRANDALNCYLKSLSLRGRNNAAIIHICRLIYKLVNDKARI